MRLSFGAMMHAQRHNIGALGFRNWEDSAL
jgi:hypothetical protein